MGKASLTVSQILTHAAECLRGAGYQEVERAAIPEWPSSRGRFFEDRYGIVAVLAFESWSSLRDGWRQSQSRLIEFLEDHLSRDQSKSWDGYLVLMTPVAIGAKAQDDADKIRYDLSRVRKFVITGERLATLADVESSLLPLLPLESNDVDAQLGSALVMLPDLLSKGSKEIQPPDVRVIVDAFEDGRSLMKALHDRLHAASGR